MELKTTILKDIESQWDLFLNLSHEIGCIFNADGLLKKVNRKFTEVTGFAQDEVLSQPLHKFIHADDWGTLHGFDKLNTNSIKHFENRCICKNNSYISLGWSINKVDQEHIYASAQRINSPSQIKVKKESATLQDKCEISNFPLDEICNIKRLQNVIENFSEGYFTLSRDWKLLSVNAAVEKMAGISKEKLLTTDFWGLFPAAKNLKFYREYNRAFEENVPIHFEEFYPPLNIWVEVKAYPYEDSLTAFIKDITPIKENLKKLKSSEENYKKLFLNNPVPMWAHDMQDFTFKAVNNAVINLYGYTRKEFLKMNLFDIMAEEEHPRLKKAIRNYRGSNVAFN